MSIIERVKLDSERLEEGKVRKNGYNNWKRVFGGNRISFKWLLPVDNQQ